MHVVHMVISCRRRDGGCRRSAGVRHGRARAALVVASRLVVGASLPSPSAVRAGSWWLCVGCRAAAWTVISCASEHRLTSGDRVNQSQSVDHCHCHSE